MPPHPDLTFGICATCNTRIRIPVLAITKNDPPFTVVTVDPHRQPCNCTSRNNDTAR